MPATIYRSTDPGAPTITGNTAGALITLLDAVLVNGYGSKAPAGWTKEFSGTNKAAYRNGAAAKSRSYLRVDDTATGQATLVGYDTMSDIDNGTVRFPTGTAYQYVGKTAEAGNEWTVVADQRTVFGMIKRTENPKHYASFYFGDTVSPLANDINQCALAGGWGSTYNFAISFTPQFNADASRGFWRKGPLADIIGTPIACGGLAGSGSLCLLGAPPASGSSGLLNPTQPSGYILANRIHYYLFDGSAENRTYGGRFRFVLLIAHYYSSFTEYGTDLSGIGELAGRNIRTLGLAWGNPTSTSGVYLPLAVDVDDDE